MKLGEFVIEYLINDKWADISYCNTGFLSIGGSYSDEKELYLWQKHYHPVIWDTDTDNRPIIDGVDEL